MAVPCSANKIFIPTYRKKRFSCQGHDCSTTTIFLVRFNRYTRTRFVTLREKRGGGGKRVKACQCSSVSTPKMTSSFPDLLKIFFDERRACPVKIKSSKVPFINQRGILLSSSLIASSASDAHPAGNQKGKHFEKRDSTLYPSRPRLASVLLESRAFNVHRISKGVAPENRSIRIREESLPSAGLVDLEYS